MIGTTFFDVCFRDFSQTYLPKILERYKLCPNMDDCLNRLHQNHRLALAVSREHAKTNERILPSQLECFDNSEIIHEYDLTFLARNNFTYLTKLNKFIQMARSGGLIEKWRRDNQHQTYKRTKLIRTQLKVHNFYGIFSLWMFFFAFQSFTLIWEKIVYQRAHMPNPTWIWVLFEMAIDPERYHLLETKRFQ